MLAGAISCFFMMSFIPFSLFLVSILGYLLGQPGQFDGFFRAQIINLFPQITDRLAAEINSIIHYREIGIVNLLLYVVFSYQLYMSLEKALGKIFKVNGKRHAILSFLIALAIVTLVIVFLVFSFAISGVIALAEKLHNYFPALHIGVLMSIFSRFLLPAFLLFLLATSLYLLLPRKKISLHHALWGGLFASIFFEAAKHVFTFYVTSKISRLGSIYGSLTVIVTLLIWLFYSASIFLVGAELVYNLGNQKRKRKRF